MKANGITKKRSFYKDRLSILKEIYLQLTDERKKRVIDLYVSQHKTYIEIAEIERMSPRDIHAIIKEEETTRQKYQHQQQQGVLSSKAYELFSKRKTPVEVAIALNLREPEVTNMYREYWKLKRLDKLDSAYKELGDDGMRNFLKLYRLAKKEGVSVEQVVKLLLLVDERNPFGLIQLEKRREWLIAKIHDLDMQIERSKNYLQSLSNQIANARNWLSDYNIS
jgi:predicted DNA-binding protein YlxM (UPF0122 family)